MNNRPSRRASSQAGSEVEDRSVAYRIRWIVVIDPSCPASAAPPRPSSRHLVSFPPRGSCATVMPALGCLSWPDMRAGDCWRLTSHRVTPRAGRNRLTGRADSKRPRHEVRHGRTLRRFGPSSVTVWATVDPSQAARCGIRKETTYPAKAPAASVRAAASVAGVPTPPQAGRVVPSSACPYKRCAGARAREKARSALNGANELRGVSDWQGSCNSPT